MANLRKSKSARKIATPRKIPLAKVAVSTLIPTNPMIAQLQSRESDIRAWFATDPSRVTALQTKTKETLAELSKALGVTLTAKTTGEKLPYTVVLNPLICACGPPGSDLLGEVWSYIGANATNLAAWNADPYSVINQVATDTGASASDTQAVTQAFEQILGTTPITISISQIQAALSHQRPKQLVVR